MTWFHDFNGAGYWGRSVNCVYVNWSILISYLYSFILKQQSICFSFWVIGLSPYDIDRQETIFLIWGRKFSDLVCILHMEFLVSKITKTSWFLTGILNRKVDRFLRYSACILCMHAHAWGGKRRKRKNRRTPRKNSYANFFCLFSL